MKKNNYTHIISLLLCFATLSAFAQSGLTISAGSSIFISNGTIFSTDSLAIAPSAGFTISGANTETRDAVATHASANPYIKRVFHFANTLPSFTGAITIYYLNAELNAIPESLLTLNVNDGTAWNPYNLNVTRDAVNNFVTTTGLTNINLNELTLAGTTGPLPVTFVSFNSACIAGGVKITWTTAQELNSKNFNVEKSADGSTWQVIASVPASGTSNTAHSYTFADNNSSGNTFYRIAENDIDGRKTISIIIKSSCAIIETFVLHPNPVHDIVFVNISVSKTMLVRLRLYDAKGTLVKQLQNNLLQGANQLQLNMEGLAAGIYTLNANWGSNNKTSKIVKE